MDIINRQKSYSEKSTGGQLYLVPTPIGNLQDTTVRCKEILALVDYIAAEDTRETKKLLSVYEISKPVISYHEHNKYKREQQLIDDLKAGKQIALVSDAGMPAISDPGYELVQAALAAGIPVIPLPGPNAALTALIASGLPTQHFLFIGFLDRNKKQRKNQLEPLVRLPYTIILYEAPHRLKQTLGDILSVMGNRKITLARELTKKFEEFIRTDVEQLLALTEQEQLKGECCLILEGNTDGTINNEDQNEQWWEHLTLKEHVEHYLHEGQSLKQASKQVAEERGQKSREVYQAYHQE